MKSNNKFKINKKLMSALLQTICLQVNFFLQKIQCKNKTIILQFNKKRKNKLVNTKNTRKNKIIKIFFKKINRAPRKSRN